MRTYLPTHFKFCSVNEQIANRESRSIPDAIHGQNYFNIHKGSTRGPML